MINQKLTTILKDPRTNWKYILIAFIFATIVGGGILLLSGLEEMPPTGVKPLEVTLQEIPKDELTDLSECDKIQTNPARRDVCYSDVAVAELDSPICAKIQNVPTRDR